MSSLSDALPDSSVLSGRKTAADHVADALRKAISSGQLADGTVLNQVELATHFGVSRVPVREAMRLLQAEGLITGEAYSKAVVRGLSLPTIIETHELRALIEGYLVEHATPRITRDQLAQAAALEKEMRASTTDPTRWTELNAEFHRTLYAAAAAPTALELAEQLRTRAARYNILLSGAGYDKRRKEADREHARILKAMRAGDAAAARDLLSEHVLHTRDAFAALKGSLPAG